MWGDRVSVTPSPSFEFTLTGEFAPELAGEDPASNLVWRATQGLFARAGAPPPPLRITLDKALPVAAGLGGGSSDAGAALMLLRDVTGIALDDAALEALAGALGADGPACLRGEPVLAAGYGEQLSPAPAMPPLPAVLINPRVACSTGHVYRAFDALGPHDVATAPKLPTRFSTVEALVALLRDCRNDLEPAAIAVTPQIEPVLGLLRTQPEALLARLSGSGATAFTLCADGVQASRLAARVAELQPGWWVRACRLGGPWSTAGDAVTNP